ncbi:MAG: hypothetical protein V3R96_01535 [Dehalococcoidales bacterium]
MTWQKVWQLLRSDYLMVVPVLGLAFYIAFIPHLDYPYPLHVDEWVHLARSNAMLQSGSITIADPLLGGATLGLSSNLEAGFQLFWAAFQAISSISWMDIYRYFPSIIFMLTVFSVFIMARKEGFGLEAAFFVCLIPTSVGVLGPAFLVPASLGLLFTPLILFLAFNFRNVWTYVLIFVLIAFLLSIHAPSAIYPIIMLIPYLLLNLKNNFRHSLGTTLALFLPFFIIFPWIFSLVKSTAGGLFTQTGLSEFVQLPRVIQEYGFLPLSLCLLGIFLLAIKGGKKEYGLVLGLLAMLIMLVSYYTFHYGVWIMYERGLTFMLLIAGIIAGAGLAWIKNLRLPERLSQWIKIPLVTQNIGKLPYLVLIGIILAIAIPARQGTSYYHMIDEEDYQAFAWIEENIDSSYGRAILDPWKATAFSAITGKPAYTRIHSYPRKKDKKAYEFLSGGSANTTFLRENGISIVYNRVYDGLNGNIEYEINNPDLIEVTKGVYLLTETGEEK